MANRPQVQESDLIARALLALEVDSEWSADRLLDAIGDAIALLVEAMPERLQESGTPRIVSVDATLDGLASCLLEAQAKVRALQHFVACLMVDAEESIGGCECEPCKRLRRGARTLLAHEGTPEALDG